MTSQYDVVIVGGGHAGAQTAIELRQRGFEGSVAIVGNEPVLPYDRPALSKEYLSGRLQLDAMLLRPASFWAEQNIALHLGHEVTLVEPVKRFLLCQGGMRFGYRKLVWAAGGSPRRLPFTSAATGGVHAIRTSSDVDRIKRELPETARVIVIGGGYLGLEAAAALREMEKSVVLIEASDRLLPRVTGDTISRFYEAEHRARGVDIRLGASVLRVVESSGTASGIELESGEIISGDMIIVAIGIVPAVQPLLAVGAAGSGSGIFVDAGCRTSLPDVYAVGDCAERQNAFAGGSSLRLESIQNANDQASIAARSILGAAASQQDAVPWFWSNQFDLRLQTVGLSASHEQSVLRGDPDSRSFSVVYLREGRVIALDCVNASKDFLHGRALVQSRIAPDLDRLGDTTIPLKDLARSETGAPSRRATATATEAR